MREERIEMTQEERDRLFIIRQAARKQVSQREAAEREDAR